MIYKFNNLIMNEFFENIDLLIDEDFDIFDQILFLDKPYTCQEFIYNFPKKIFFEDKMDIFKFFLHKGYSFYSVNWIVYNQLYLCTIINNPYFNDFLELIYERNKENINFFSEDDIFYFITDSKYNFKELIFKCNNFFEELKIDEHIIDLSILNYELANYRLEDVD